MGETKCSTHTISEFVEEIKQMLLQPEEQPRTFLCINAHIFNLSCEDVLLRADLNSARVVAADGMSIVWASRLWRQPVRSRCNMTEAFKAFLKSTVMPRSRGVLVGLMPGEALLAARAMESQTTHLTIPAVCSGYLSEQEYEAYFLTQQDKDFILVGMGSPRTERICRIAAQCCPQSVVWGIGAGTIRIFSGTMREAPVLMRRTGLQWLHRLLAEPRLLWRRYLFGNPLFVFRILKLILGTPAPVAQETSVSEAK